MDMLELLTRNRAQAQDSLDALLAIPAAESRDLNQDEATRFEGLRADIVRFDERVAELQDLAERQQAADAAAAQVNNAAPVRVNSEPPVYGRGTDNNLIADLFNAQVGGDPEARERIVRHNNQLRGQTEYRDVGTSAFGALVPPQYLTDLWAPLARAGRPVANACRSLSLPSTGMVLNIPRITTGTGTAIQATENAAVQETDLDETTLAINVRTIAGMQDVSRQAIERGEMIEEVVFGDLMAAYAANLDSQIISADGTSGTHLGILSTVGIEAVTYTDATPTVAELYPKLADAIQRINSLRFLPATVIFMHPRRWGWLTAAVDSTGRPFVVPNSQGPMNAAGVGDAAGYGTVVGTILGLPVVTDANIPTNLGTNEDIIIVARADDLLLFEDGDGAPRQLRFEQTLGGNLTIKLVLYGFSAFAAGRYPKAVATVGGSGLILPTF